ncbi:MAG: hypothetical protein ACRETL_15120, partial [Gammaproteobacteria bacterium]
VVTDADDEVDEWASADDETGEAAADDDDLLELGEALVAGPEQERPAYQPVDVTPAPERPAPRISTGGTLFERMSNLSRGLTRADDDDDNDNDGSPTPNLNIPRFLDRLSNN